MNLWQFYFKQAFTSPLILQLNLTSSNYFCSMLLFLNLGGGEIVLISFFVLMFFGSKQIPDLMRGLGRATREFKDAMNGIEREVRSAASMEDEKEKKKEELPKQLPPSEPQSEPRNPEQK
jgi:sec-independent protein translocase protein TatA